MKLTTQTTLTLGLLSTLSAFAASPRVVLSCKDLNQADVAQSSASKEYENSRSTLIATYQAAAMATRDGSHNDRLKMREVTAELERDSKIKLGVMQRTNAKVRQLEDAIKGLATLDGYDSDEQLKSIKTLIRATCTLDPRLTITQAYQDVLKRVDENKIEL